MAATPPALASKITRLEMPMAIVGRQYCVPYDVELIATEKVFYIGNANVKDTNGNLLLKVKGRFLGIHEKRWLCDANDVKIVTLQAKIRTKQDRWNMYRGDSTDKKDLICTIIPKKSPPEYHVFLASNTSNEKQCDLKMKKGYNNQQITFYLGDTDKMVAQILFDKDSYRLTIFSNMDYAFVVAMTSVLDAIRDASKLLKTTAAVSSWVNLITSIPS